MANTKHAPGSHDQEIVAYLRAVSSMSRSIGSGAGSPLYPPGTTFTTLKFHYTFRNFFHPFVGELIAKLNRDSLPGMLDPNWQDSLKEEFFPAFYRPAKDNENPPPWTVEVTSFPKEIDLDLHGPYANYNWELLFHVPFTIAVHLSKTQRFAEAQRWFHYIFDPTSNDQTVDPPARYWKFLAFRKPDHAETIDEIVRLLSTPTENLTDPGDKDRQRDAWNGYAAILNNPFNPHAVARTRLIAYQYSVVMKYLDNLIVWGDNLFQQDTVESINEATQRYVLAANILGPRPQQIPPQGTMKPKTFKQLKEQGLGVIGDALADLEAQFPFNLAPSVATGASASASDNSRTLFGIGRALYFCIPRNDRLLGYWDTVGDRLFKIRNCMNIEGVVRPLALFDPPLDPGMLVKAVAAGMDISSIVNGLNQPIGPVRSLTLIQKALELCAEVRSLGSSLLSAIEKGDSEHLALVRQRHEIQIQQMSQDIRFLQWKSAQESTKSLLTSRATAIERLRFYQRVLGLPLDPNAPDTITLEHPELTENNFDEAYSALVGQYDRTLTLQRLAELRIAGSTSPAQQSGAIGQGRLYLNTNENAELNEHLPTARDRRLESNVANILASVLAPIPSVEGHLAFWGLGFHSNLFSGMVLSHIVKIGAEVLQTLAAWEQDQAGMAARTAGHERRADEWILQYNLAAHEVMQIGRQILTSLIAEQIAHHEYLNLQQQIANAQEIDHFLHDKFTNEELYLWMQGEVSRLYYEYYRFAFDTARRAELTMKQELMRPELDSQDFVKFNYWDGGRKGLLSGEELHLDVKRMEMAYYDNNKRELELTRHVSLRQLDPLALLNLKATGTCQVTIPEWLYDRDCPGHYMRRIKSVAVSIPAVVGPFTTVNCTLSLLKSSLRKSPLPKDGEYARAGIEDDRFIDYAGAVQSIVTSGGTNDSGLFETNLRDERFLPFEGAGAISTWKLDLPSPRDYPAFDYTTISDVVLHIRYTARQGVDPTKVKAALDELFGVADQSRLALLFSLRHDFPTEWAAFVSGGVEELSLTIRKEYFPYFAQTKTIKDVSLDLYSEDMSKTKHLDNAVDLTGGAFTLKIGPNEVLTRPPDGQVFLIVGYTLGE